ncbi:43kDa postsynaptic protein [Parasponia andersonii]|uniref:43kDa postsynaptic protein n=1 Tax=Parasponia andersonii TaxID=3476 RepID=A0A2P5CJ38_PARAD|nr:43kDa postsynaptic protein [Parasponia andersonii]
MVFKLLKRRRFAVNGRHLSPATRRRLPLAHAPILLLVYFHKAFRAEVADLRRVVSDALERGHCTRGLAFELLPRFEFLKLACRYHCAAEDEVIFLALDVHVQNVARTYSLEHKSIDRLFDSIFNRLNAILMEENENDQNDGVLMKPFQELVFCIGTIQTFISKHMLKEEEQIFPSLMKHISVKEQASLVWKFMCSVPIVLMEDMLPWTLSFLSLEEQIEVTNCIKEIVPEEKLLQEVVLSWLGSKSHPSVDSYIKGGEVQSSAGSADMRILLKPYSCRRFLGENWRTQTVHNDIGHNPVDGLHLWHCAIRKDLIALLEELYQSRSTSNFLNLDRIVVRLKFIADIITFYSNALEKLFCPVLSELVQGCKSPSTEGFHSESHIEGLQMLLYYSARNDTTLSKFVEKLCWELESFVVEISKQFDFHEAEVFPIISRNCSHDMQQQLLYVSVHIMPLGLLKCVITWFSAHLSEDESRSILNRIKQGDALINGSFASLLREWFRIGCSGKISVEKFGSSLQQMFKSRFSFLSDQIKDAAGSSSLQPNKQSFEESECRVKSLSSLIKGKSSLSYSPSFGSQNARKYETSYSSVINLHIYFPEKIKTYHPFSGENHSGSVLIDPKPMDLILYFHKALKKDLEHIVHGSTQLAENPGFLADFCRRFKLIQFLYRIHSEAEDEVAFPALEAMGKVTNISHSYTMDHKLEVEHFERVSIILDKLSELNVSISNVNSNMDQNLRKHYQLCMMLHDMCESMNKMLVDHIHREEVELWPLFRDCFSLKEQERIIGSILGRTKAEILQDMIPWLMGSLTQEEQHTMMSIWRQVTKNTMFDEWLREWWEEYDISEVAEESNVAPSTVDDPLEIVYKYLCEVNEQEGKLISKNGQILERDCLGDAVKQTGDWNVDDKTKDSEFRLYDFNSSEHRGSYGGDEKKRIQYATQNVTSQIKPGLFFQAAQKSKYYDFLLKMNQEDLEIAIRRVSGDSSLDSQKKSYIIQNLLVSRWIVRQQHSHSIPSSEEQEFPGQHPSYRDPLKLSYGCKHYKRNCKLVAPCCNQLYNCLRCHDDMAGHLIDRKSVTEMMCMQCLKIQPIGPTCSTASCSKFSMARYFCRICKIFDDERDKCFMDNCPICHEDIFTSSLPVKALQCGHLMHSKCFEDYTCTNYTCPICCKSLGDMQVYFKMLDALLAEEKIPHEYSGQTQVILCNDCGKRGEAPFHWLYHKCPICGSYNTRLL